MDLADGLQMTSKQEKQLESAVTILSGIAAWEYQATQKFDAGVSLISKQRFGDAIAQTFGNNVAQKLFPGTSIQGKQTVNPQGVLNSTMGYGIVLLIADAVADEVGGKTYRDLDGLQPVVRGAGKGLLIGGIVGGFFDPSYGTAAPAPGYTISYPRGPDLGAGMRVNQLNR
jgi:hypothetical protein